MSLNKIKSLRLHKSSQQCEPASNAEADVSMILREETKNHTERMERSSKNHESLTPLHSTPKRSSGKSKGGQGRSGLGYQVSPILLPCTQEGGNEIIWDWQSPLKKSNKKNNRNNGEIIGTPKRTTLLQKKRNSNSPLLYEPIKRKLLRNEHQQESIDQFTAEMKALTEQIRTVPKDEGSNERTNESEDGASMEIDMNDFVECETKFCVTGNDENSTEKNGRTVSKTSMDDLFDDSIDDSMVKCSQEVEEKLRLESCRETSSKRNSNDSTGARESSSSWHRQSYSRSLTAKDRSGESTRNSSKFGNGENSSRLAKNSSSDAKVASSTGVAKKSSFTMKNSSLSSTSGVAPRTKETSVSSGSSSLRKSSRTNDDSSKREKSGSSPTIPTQTDVFEIPDDSFDDFIAIGLDDVENSASKSDAGANQSCHRYGKFYASPHSAGPSDNHRRFEKSSARNILLPPPSQSSGAAVKAPSTSGASSNTVKIFPRSASNDSLNPNSGYRPQAVFQSQTTITASTATKTINQERKFFKTKSLSTSNFDDQGVISKNVNTASSSSLNSRGWKSSMFANGSVSTSVSNNQRKPFKTDGNGESNAWPRSNGNEGNRRVCNVDRTGPREGDSVRSKGSNGGLPLEGKPDAASGSQSTQICTPEEIERKRLEAKMKLEAKKKLIGRSTSANAFPGGTARKPVKR